MEIVETRQRVAKVTTLLEDALDELRRLSADASDDDWPLFADKCDHAADAVDTALARLPGVLTL